MPVHYCSSCGSPAQYSITKPLSCPKCGHLFKTIAASFATVKIVPVAPPALPEESEDDGPLIPVATPARKMVPKRATSLAAARAKIKAEQQPDPELGGDDDDSDEVYDKRQMRALARELIATIDPSTIHVGIEDDEAPVTYGDLVRGAQTKRNQ